MRPWTVNEFSDLLSSPHVYLLDKETAFALIRVVADEAEILTLATDPVHRRSGMGLALLGEAETLLRSKNVAKIFLEVSDANQPAQALYAKAGFAETARRPNYYVTPAGQRVDALILQKDL